MDLDLAALVNYSNFFGPSDGSTFIASSSGRKTLKRKE